MKIVLQYTSGAFSGDIPEGQWKTAQGHYRTIKMAQAALDRELAAMRERCGGSAWDSHHRLVNAGPLPIRLKVRYGCYGSHYEHKRAPDCHKEIVIEYTWDCGAPMPPAPLPQGWGPGSDVCPACVQFDDAYEEHERPEWDRERQAEFERERAREQAERAAQPSRPPLPHEHRWAWSDNAHEWYCSDCGEIAASKNPLIEPCLGCGAEVGPEVAYCGNCQG